MLLKPFIHPVLSFTSLAFALIARFDTSSILFVPAALTHFHSFLHREFQLSNLVATVLYEIDETSRQTTHHRQHLNPHLDHTMSSGRSSVSSLASSFTQSAPTTPLAAVAFTHKQNPHMRSRWRAASAPAAYRPDLISYSSSGMPFHAHHKSSSWDSSWSTSASDESLLAKSANIVKEKRKKQVHSSSTSTATGRKFQLSFRNIYTTKDFSGRMRVGGGSGVPAGCVVM